MICKNCNSKIHDAALICPYCGAETENNATSATPVLPTNPGSKANPQQFFYNPIKIDVAQIEHDLIALLGFIFAFCFPIAGLVLSIIGLKSEKRYTLALAGTIISAICVGSIFILTIVISV